MNLKTLALAAGFSFSWPVTPTLSWNSSALVIVKTPSAPVMPLATADPVKSESHEQESLVMPSVVLEPVSSTDAVITGDLIHSPLQARYPELSTSIDYDPAQAAETRLNFLETYCDTSTLVCFTHFPSPSFGYVKKWDEGFRSEPIPESGEAPDATTWRL